MANKEQTAVLQPKKGEEKPAKEKKSQPPAKVKKSAAAAGQTKKRRFTFFSDIIAELKKVVWPTRQETTRLTLIVIGLCLVMGLILGLVDFGFSELVAKVFLGGK